MSDRHLVRVSPVATTLSERRTSIRALRRVEKSLRGRFAEDIDRLILRPILDRPWDRIFVIGVKRCVHLFTVDKDHLDVLGIGNIFEGSPRTMTTSAILPFSTLPYSLSLPHACATLILAVEIACKGVRPASTSISSSACTAYPAPTWSGSDPE